MSPDVIVDLGEAVAPGPGACDTTLADVIHQTRRLLLTGRRDQRNRLTASISAGATSLAIDFAAGGIADGARIAIDLEHFHVYDVTGSTVTVESAQDGTTAAVHAGGSIIRVNTQYSDFEILNAVNDVLRDLSSPGCGLFRVSAVDLSWDPNVLGYDLTDTTSVYDVLDVYYQQPSNQNRWIRVPKREWRFQRSADLTAFPSGNGLTFLGRLTANSGDVVRVNYKTKYGFVGDYADNIEAVTGLGCEAHDLLWIGAAIRLSDSREIERNSTFTQGDPRRSQEVPANAQNAAVAGLLGRWKSRLQSEGARLSRDWPVFLR